MSMVAEASSEAILTGTRAGALTGDVEVPGDKSMSHRALILGGMAHGETRISGLLEGDDVLHTAGAVRAFGAQVERLGRRPAQQPGWRQANGGFVVPSGRARRRQSTAATAGLARAC